MKPVYRKESRAKDGEVDTEMYLLGFSSGNDKIPSYRERGQQMVQSCQLLQSLPWLWQPASPGPCPYGSQSTLVTEQGRIQSLTIVTNLQKDFIVNSGFFKVLQNLSHGFTSPPAFPSWVTAFTLSSISGSASRILYLG